VNRKRALVGTCCSLTVNCPAMLCELNVWGNFFITWAFISVIGWISLMCLSGVAFYRYYVRPTYEDWRYKSNPEYPEPSKVKEEIWLMSTGMPILFIPYFHRF
jgi:hypothetical protein